MRSCDDFKMQAEGDLGPVTCGISGVREAVRRA
jgi:hypothetical protein